MYKQGNSDTKWKGYQLAAVAYQRLDCEKRRLCILVLGQTGFEVEPSLDNAWFKDYQSGLPGDKYQNDPGIVFVKSGNKNVGWEGCFTIPDVAMANPARNQIEIHVNYRSGTSGSWDTGSTGKSQHGYTVMNLCPIAQPETVPVTTPITEPAAAPITEPVATPVTEPVTAPINVPVSDPIGEPVVEPVTAPVDDSPPAEPGMLDFDPANQGGQFGDDQLDDDEFDETELEPLTIDLGPANQGGGYGDPVSLS